MINRRSCRFIFRISDWGLRELKGGCKTFSSLSSIYTPCSKKQSFVLTRDIESACIWGWKTSISIQHEWFWLNDVTDTLSQPKQPPHEGGSRRETWGYYRVGPITLLKGVLSLSKSLSLSNIAMTNLPKSKNLNIVQWPPTTHKQCKLLLATSMTPMTVNMLQALFQQGEE